MTITLFFLGHRALGSKSLVKRNILMLYLISYLIHMHAIQVY